MLETAISAFVGVLIGGLITWAVARHYYVKAAVDLDDATTRLKDRAEKAERLSSMILRWLELEGQNIELVRDETGAIIGIRHVVEVTDSLQFSCSLTGGTMEPADEEKSNPRP